MRIGYFLSSEEFGPEGLLQQARLAERAGFEGLWISDHFHPWNDEQGESTFVWSVIGALSRVCTLPLTTAVTCPTVRIHPAIVAQAAATCALLTGGKFTLGVGTGEALNEQILGDRWPPARQRFDMLEEAIDVMRELFTGEVVNHDGTHYTVQHARLYSLPEQPPRIYVSAFGSEAVRRAAKVADGLCTVGPAGDVLQQFRDSGGRDKTAQTGLKVCVGEDVAAARRTAHRLWANEQLPGELGQILPTPEHIMQASTLVTEEMVAENVVCGNQPEAHLERIQQFADAGFDELYIGQIGPNSQAFFDLYGDQVLPRLVGS